MMPTKDAGAGPPPRAAGGTTQPDRCGPVAQAARRFAVTLVPGSGPHSTAELQARLRRRLRAFALIRLVAAGLITLVETYQYAGTRLDPTATTINWLLI